MRQADGGKKKTGANCPGRMNCVILERPDQAFVWNIKSSFQAPASFTKTEVLH